VKNIEIKAPAPDPALLEERLNAIEATHEWTRRQRDTFFHVAEGYLKLRVVDGEPGELIAYRRAPGPDPRPSDYDIAPVDDPARLETVLARCLGVRGVVEKTRRYYRRNHTRIHLDEVQGLGGFVELETVASRISLEQAEAEAREVIDLLGLEPSTFLDRPYLELLEAAPAGRARAAGPPA
jgi:predicted adenylyl cyclase CyaB